MRKGLWKHPRDKCGLVGCGMRSRRIIHLGSAFLACDKRRRGAALEGGMELDKKYFGLR